MAQLRFKVGDQVLIAHEGTSHYSPARILGIGALTPKGKKVKTPSSTPNDLPRLIPVDEDTKEEDLRYHIHYDGWDSWYDEVVETRRVLKRPGAERSRVNNLDTGVKIISQDNGECRDGEGDPKESHSHDGDVGQDIDMDVVGEGESKELEDVTQQGESWTILSVSGGSSDSQSPPQSIDDLNLIDEEVVILSTQGFNSSSESEPKDEMIQVFNYSKDVPRYLRELLHQDGLDTLKGNSQLCQGGFHGWTTNEALTQYVKDCKVQRTPGLMDIKRYVIQLRASMFKAIEDGSLFYQQEWHMLDRITEFASYIDDTDILTHLPVIFLLRLFCKGPPSVRKEFHDDLIKFLTLNVDVCFPSQVQAHRSQEKEL